MRRLFASLALAALLAGITIASPETAEAEPHTDGVQCREVIFVGVRGSGEAPGHGPTVWDAFTTLEETVGSHRIAQRWLGDPYPALGTEAIRTDIFTLRQDYAESVTAGQDALEQYLIQVTNKCDSWIVLAGYSQGALVIRLALESLANHGYILSEIGGIALFGDPARSTDDAIDNWGGANDEPGVFHKFIRSVAPVPLTRGFSGSWCLPDDGVCEVNSIFDLTPGSHGDYQSNSLPRIAGYWIGQDLLELPDRPGSNTDAGSTSGGGSTGGEACDSELSALDHQSFYDHRMIIDFNGNGISDVFIRACSGIWRVRYDGKGDWVDLNTNASSATIDRLRFGNFDGDNKTDVFIRDNSGTWRVRYDGKGHWIDLNTSKSSVSVDRLRFGNFDGDNLTDVFIRASDGVWKVRYDGRGGWKNLNTSKSSVSVDRLRFGNFDGDNLTDVFVRASDGVWKVRYDGRGGWKNLNTSASGVGNDRLHLGNFDSDSRTDIFIRQNDGVWRVRYAGRGGWVNLNTAKSGVPNDRLRIL